MKELQVFNFNDAPVRVVAGQDGEPWFVAKDVAEVLGYSNPLDAVAKHCKNSISNGFAFCDSIGRTQKTPIIPERDVYRLVMRSKLPSAERFEEWVVGEVLPSIRKHGAYMTPEKVEEALLNPDVLIRLATDLKSERERRRALAAKVERDRPKVVFSDAVTASRTSILVGELAKLLRQNGVEIGQNRFFEWLRDNGYLMKTGSSRNMPTQRAMEAGLFEIKETVVSHSDGHIDVKKTPKVTGKGQRHFVNLFLDRKRAV